MHRPLQNGFATTLLWLCTAALILTKTLKLIARADFVMLACFQMWFLSLSDDRLE